MLKRFFFHNGCILVLFLGKARSSYDLYFWRKNADDYVQENLTEVISEFTVSVWMKTADATTKLTLFSIGNSEVNLDFKIKNSGRESGLCLRLSGVRHCR